MNEYRLVVQVRNCSWGSEGLEWTEKTYVLQTRETFNRLGDGKLVTKPWVTVPTVNHANLPTEEKEEILAAHGFKKNPVTGYWSPPE